MGRSGRGSRAHRPGFDALRNFDPANVALGSCAAEMMGTMRPLMSASPRKQTNVKERWQVRFVPLPDSCSAAKTVLIRSPRRREAGSRWARWHDCLGGFQVDGKLEMSGLLDRQVGRLGLIDAGYAIPTNIVTAAQLRQRVLAERRPAPRRARQTHSSLPGRSQARGS